MLLDSYDLELLKLCGLCRYMPLGLRQRYDNPVLIKSVADNLKLHNFVKSVDAKEKCIRLTGKGKVYLADMGCEFADDARPRKEGSIFKRRIVSADMSVLLHSAGINVFAGSSEELNTDNTKYISSLTMRANKKSKALAGTRFLGILKLHDTAYVPYYTDSIFGGIYPGYEKPTFENIISCLNDVSCTKIIIVGKTLEELWSILFPIEQIILPRGEKPFSTISEVWEYDICLMPLNRDGALQASIMAIQNFRKTIGGYYGATENIPKALYACDAISEESTFVVAMDMNITRIEQALKQSKSANKIPNLICFRFQRDMLRELITLKSPQEARFKIINKNKIGDLFPSLRLDFEKVTPCMTKKGDYVSINDSG